MNSARLPDPGKALEAIGKVKLGSKLVALEEFAEEGRGLIRDPDDLVRGLTIEFEIELGPGLPVIPLGEMPELAPPQWPLRERGASDGDAHTRCLPSDAASSRPPRRK